MRRSRQPGTGHPAPEPEVVVVAPEQLRQLFAAPGWLRNLGVMSWLLVGFALLLVGIVWLLGATSTIVIPVILGSVIGAVAGPLVDVLGRRGLPRAAGAAVVMVLLLVLGVLILLLVLGGLTSQSSSISNGLNKAVDEIQGWLNDLGITKSKVKPTLEKDLPKIGSALVGGVSTGVKELTSIVTLIVFTAFSSFFVMKDAPVMGAWIERNMGLPLPVARVVTHDTAHALRQYFLGVTIVAAFNALVIGGGAVLLGVPLAGTIAVVTFIGAYVPFIGAWVAGIFAVLLALSSGGTADAIPMGVIALLANGALQQVVQPIAFGATLSLNPLVVLVVTIGGGALFGMVGLLLAAPLTSAAVSILGHVAHARAEAEAAEADADESPPGPDAGAAPDPAPA